MFPRPCRPCLTPLDRGLARIAIGGCLDNPYLPLRRLVTRMDDAARVRDASDGDPRGQPEDAGRATKDDEWPASIWTGISSASSFVWRVGRTPLAIHQAPHPPPNRDESQSAVRSSAGRAEVSGFTDDFWPLGESNRVE